MRKRDPFAPAQVPHTEFDFRRIRFELDTATNTFSPLRFPDSGTVRDYLTCRGLGSEAEAVAALEKWGANTAEVPVPRFMDLLKEQMVAPFFIFQVCFGAISRLSARSDTTLYLQSVLLTQAPGWQSS